MKIIEIIARMNIGGPALHLCQLMEGLRGRANFDMTLIHGRVAEGEGSMMHEAEKRNLKSIYVPELSREISPLMDLISVGKVFIAICKLRPSVVHTHTAKAGMIGRLVTCIFPDIKVIHTYHGTVFHGYGYGKLKTAFFLFLEKTLARISDRIVVLSKSLKMEMVERGIARGSRFVTIPLGFDFAPFEQPSTDIASDHGIKAELKEKTIIGFVGRLEFVKQPNFIIELAEHSKKTNESFHFVLVGDGTLMAPLKQEVKKKHLGEFVTFLGWQEDVSQFYSEFDVLMMCSNNEGTPVVIIEAMAAKCPVVSNDVGGIGDILEGESGGLIVETKSAESYFDKFRIIMKSREHFAEQASRHVRNHFSLEKMLDSYQKIYVSIAEVGKLQV